MFSSARVLTALTVFVTACEAPVKGLGDVDGEGPVTGVHLGALEGHWMLPILADNHTGEHWWTIDDAGRLLVKERRHSHCCEGNGEVIETRLAGELRVTGELLEVQIGQGDRTTTERFRAAIIPPAPFAPAFAIPEWLPWASELSPDDRILFDRVLATEDGQVFEGERWFGWSNPENGPGHRAIEIALRLDRPLAEVSEQDRVRVQIDLAASLSREQFDFSVELNARVLARPGDPWQTLELDESPWFQVVERELGERVPSSDIRSLLGSAISARLHFHPEQPTRLLGEQANLRFGMHAGPSSSLP